MISRKYVIILFIFSFLIAAVISVRFVHVGTDTLAYLDLYSQILNKGYDTKKEPGFVLIMELFSFIGAPPSLWLFTVAYFTTLFLSLSALKIYNSSMHRLNQNYIILFLSFLLMSSWYFTLTTNGIRQGLGLATLYLGIVMYLFEKKLLFLYIFIPLAISFHYSMVLIVPFLFLLNFSLNTITVIWLLLALGYVLNLNEELIKLFSDHFSIGIYEVI
jgi:hypothetical protein